MLHLRARGFAPVTNWANKLLIVAQFEVAGAVFAAVARRHDI
jgi:hypothetical protein